MSTESISIGICGAPGTGKTSLLTSLKSLIERERPGTVLTEIRGCASAVKSRTLYQLDSKGTVETQFAIDAEQLTLEQQLQFSSKISCRTLLDAFAYAKANELQLDPYYEALLPKLTYYDILIYLPIETYMPFIDTAERDKIYQRKVNNSLRRILKQYRISVQVVTGDLNSRTNLAWEAVKIRL